MMDDFVTSQRLYPSAAVAQRQALHLARPFIGRFENWNHRAARASATILSHLTSEEEKASQRTQLSDLRVEVAQAYEEFQAAIAGQPRHSRLVDVEAAFERLLSILERAKG